MHVFQCHCDKCTQCYQHRFNRSTGCHIVTCINPAFKRFLRHTHFPVIIVWMHDRKSLYQYNCQDVPETYTFTGSQCVYCSQLIGNNATYLFDGRKDCIKTPSKQSNIHHHHQLILQTNTTFLSSPPINCPPNIFPLPRTPKLISPRMYPVHPNNRFSRSTSNLHSLSFERRAKHGA
jgi:hypothetical protein